MLSSVTKCYQLELMLSSVSIVIIWCYHVMLSSGMITPPFFIFPGNFTHSMSCPRLQKRTGPAVCSVHDSLKMSWFKSPVPGLRKGLVTPFWMLWHVQCLPRSKRWARGICSVPEPLYQALLKHWVVLDLRHMYLCGVCSVPDPRVLSTRVPCVLYLSL
jgi:hypothetical protein